MRSSALIGSLAFAVMMSANVLAQFPTASKEHKVLMEEVSKWDAEVTMFMGPEGPYDPPSKSKAQETNRMVGDFWLVSDFKGSFEGLPFAGHALFGYDTKKQRFVGTWVDSFTPTPMRMVGTYDEKTKTTTYKTSYTEMDGSAGKGKNVVVYGENKRVMTMYSAEPGTDNMIKVMEITYTKAK